MAQPILTPPEGSKGRTGKLTLGEGVVFLKGVEIDLRADVEIGGYTVFGWNVTILTHEHDSLHGFPPVINDVVSYRSCPLSIGSNVYIGRNAVVMPQVGRIDDYAIIGAYSVLTHDVGYGEIWAGNPAKKVGDRK